MFLLTLFLLYKLNKIKTSYHDIEIKCTQEYLGDNHYKVVKGNRFKCQTTLLLHTDMRSKNIQKVSGYWRHDFFCRWRKEWNVGGAYAYPFYLI